MRASETLDSEILKVLKKILREEGIQLVAEDTGANYARTMSLDTGTGGSVNTDLRTG